jgi:hypothetical protein
LSQCRTNPHPAFIPFIPFIPVEKNAFKTGMKGIKGIKKNSQVTTGFSVLIRVHPCASVV